MRPDHQRLLLLPALALVTGAVAFAAAQLGPTWWSPLAILPWALVMSGAAALIILTPLTQESEDPHVGAVSVLLPGAAVAFVLHPGTLPSTIMEATWSLAYWTNLVFYGVVVLGVLGAATWWAQGAASDEVWTAVGAAVVIFAVGLLPGAHLLPAIIVIGAQVVLLVLLAPVEVNLPEVGKGLLLGVGVVTGLLLVTILLLGAGWPPKLALGKDGFGWFLVVSLSLASGVFLWHVVKHGVELRTLDG